MKNLEQNPFPVNGYYGSKLFCDRNKETKLLIENAVNGVNTLLISIRRMGKTGLLLHTLAQLDRNKKATGIYVDIYDTESLADFTNHLATAILQSVPQKNRFWKAAMDFIGQLKPVITYDELTGQPHVSLSYQSARQYEYTLKSLFEFLESQNKLIVIAIDEFQQIVQYPEKNMEAILRKHTQSLQNIRFIFSGSSSHILSQMFHHAKRPFFSSASTLSLQEIDESVYRTFIAKKFQQNDRSINEDATRFILEFTRRHTFYTQALCNKVFAAGHKDTGIKEVQSAAHLLLKQNDPVYYQYRTMLTSNQWNMLRAIASEGLMCQPNSKRMMQQHGLGSTSAVKRTLESLLEKELIFKVNASAETCYRVYDCFFSRWLERYKS